MLADPFDDLKPGFRWPVFVEKPISVPAEKLWEAISMPGNLEWCHPFCRKNPVLAWPGATSRDEVHYLNGWIFERRFSRWIEGIGYDLQIGSKDTGKTSFVSWRIRSHSSNQASLQITVYPFLLQSLPVAIRWLPHRVWVRPMLARYLSSVVNGFDWFLIHGEPVQPNQFGPHPWFSGAKN